MVSENDLYKVIKQTIPDSIKTRFGYSRLSEKSSDGFVRQISNTMAIYFKVADKPKRTLSGDYYGYSKRVIFNLFTERGSEDIITNGYLICSQIKNNMSVLHNCYVNIGTEQEPINIFIVDCELVMDTNYLGMNEQGVHTFSLEYKIKY